MLYLLSHLVAHRSNFGSHHRCLFDTVEDQLRLFAVFLCGVLDVGDGILASSRHLLRAVHTVDTRCTHLLKGFNSALILCDHGFGSEFAYLINIGVMLNIWRHRRRLRSYRRRKIYSTVISRRRAFCQCPGNVLFDLNQFQNFTVGSGLYHYSILPSLWKTYALTSGAERDRMGLRPGARGRHAPSLTKTPWVRGMAETGRKADSWRNQNGRRARPRIALPRP